MSKRAAVVDLVGAMRKSAKPSAARGRDDVKRPGRENLSNVTGYFPPAVKTQLRMLSAQKSQTIQRLLGEALNDLFAKNHMPELAPLDE
jgi:hypothetical protein